MRGMNSSCVDLIYLDPPFNSKSNYAAPIGSQAAGAEFKDTWTLRDVDVAWLDLIENKYPALNRVIHAAMTSSDKSYLIYMAIRLLEMQRLLKPRGSIFLHCDPTMSHYLKMSMDAIWGRNCFRNEIVWHYQTGGGSKRWFSKKHDTILFYTTGEDYMFNGASVPRSDKSLERAKNPKGARIKSDNTFKMATDVWTDIPAMNPMSNERVGYPTQKPLGLLRRIIEASSNLGDVVFDPFCGCATSCIAAEQLQRSWVGIDISPKAAELVELRLREQVGLFQHGSHRTDIPQRTDIEPLRKYNHPENKKKLYGEQGGNCNGCKEHFKIQNLTIDHIIPKSKAGTDHLINLQLLCGHCNSVKGDRGQEYLIAKLAA